MEVALHKCESVEEEEDADVEEEEDVDMEDEVKDEDELTNRVCLFSDLQRGTRGAVPRCRREGFASPRPTL